MVRLAAYVPAPAAGTFAAVHPTSVLTAVRPLPPILMRLVLVTLCAAFAWQLWRLSDPYRVPPDDFVSSWAAGRLLVTDGNPYDPDEVLAVPRTANWTKSIPYRIWYPPWTLPLLGGFGLLPYAPARFFWYLLHAAACVWSADLLWRAYRGPARSRGIAWLVIVTFWPAVIELRTGQISALMLLGLAGFLALVEKRRWLAAGACLPLVAIKPQLLHLFWIALGLWIAAERRWDVLLGAVASILALMVVAAALDPTIVAQFLHMAMHDAPRAPASTLGTALRAVVAATTGQEHFWLQFLPPALSLFWFVPYWRRRHTEWRWLEHGPPLLLVSLMTTAYGWVYDHLILLVPVMQIATLLVGRGPHVPARAGIVVGYIAVNCAILAMNLVGVRPFWYLWVPFALAVWWAAARRRMLTI